MSAICVGLILKLGQLRALAVHWMIENSSEYSMYVGDAAEWSNYLQKMLELKTWGDELTLRAVRTKCISCHWMCTCIYCLSLCQVSDAFGVVLHVISTEQENWHIVYQPAVAKAPFRHIFLAYISPIHYNTVKLLDE